MKIYSGYNRLLASIGCVTLLFPASTQAEVFTSSVELYAPISTDRPYEWGLLACTGPGFSGDGAYFGFNIYPNGSLGNMYAANYSFGIGFSWFMVSPNSAFGPSYVQSHTALFDPSSSTVGHTSLQVNRVYYMGIWMDENPEGSSAGKPGTPGSGDAFGWVEFSYDGTKLTLLDNAIENSGAGIRIGTTEVLPSVPEPSAAVLLLLGMGWMLNGRPRYASLKRPASK